MGDGHAQHVFEHMGTIECETCGLLACWGMHCVTEDSCIPRLCRLCLCIELGDSNAADDTCLETTHASRHEPRVSLHREHHARILLVEAGSAVVEQSCESGP